MTIFLFRRGASLKIFSRNITLSPATRILKKNENFDQVIDIRVLIPLRVFK